MRHYHRVLFNHTNFFPNLLSILIIFTLFLVNTSLLTAASSNYEGSIVEEKNEIFLFFETTEEKQRFIESSPQVIKTFEYIPAVVVWEEYTNLHYIMANYKLLYIEKNHTVQINATNFSTLSAIPREQNYYHYQMVNPNGQSLIDGITGKGVRVAVIDTGIASHQDLKIAGGISTVNYTTSFTDDHGHGTHVAGIISAKHNNFGIVGLSPDVELFSIKAMGKNGDGTLDDIVEGIEWAIGNNMDIVNLSFGTSHHSPTLEKIINIAHQQGILIVGAAGNDSTRETSGYEAPVVYPAAYENVIAVSAIDKDRNISTFSNVGPEISVAAPGVEIVSTYLDGQFAKADGTSQAAPHVTGLLALLLEKYPQMNHNEIRDKLEGKVEDLGPDGFDIHFGNGLIGYHIPAQPQKKMIDKTEEEQLFFSDTSNHWAKNNISELTRLGLVSGYPDHTFRPDVPVTRAEFAKMIVDVLGYHLTNNSVVFHDVKGHWSEKHVQTAFLHKLINGFSPTEFRPDHKISREQMAIIISNSLGDVSHDQSITFNDVDTTYDAARKAIIKVANLGLIEGYPNGSYGTKDNLTRAEAVTVLTRLMNYPK
ncbi:S8 family serine peptidase [Evansella sp. AB-rgal1]|uniref:S8 family peptidase n=1 Tax=Evansella sp. AB-rgal1 TaxID=3242696 RepID=UPI00359E7E07